MNLEWMNECMNEPGGICEKVEKVCLLSQTEVAILTDNLINGNS